MIDSGSLSSPISFSSRAISHVRCIDRASSAASTRIITAFNTDKVVSADLSLSRPLLSHASALQSALCRNSSTAMQRNRWPATSPHLRPFSVQVVIFVEYSYIRSSFPAISCRPSMYAEKKRLALGRLPDRYIYHNVPITAVKSSVGTESTDPVVSINHQNHQDTSPRMYAHPSRNKSFKCYVNL